MSSLITDNFKRTKRVARQAKTETKDQGQSTSSALKKEEHKDLETLRDFDLTLEFGPCSGISRMERWTRAEKHGLKPPVEVKDLIEKNANNELYTECLWKDYSI